jgi:hypothetical protein
MIFLQFLILRVKNQVVLGPGEAITLETPGYNAAFLPGCQVQIVGFRNMLRYNHGEIKRDQRRSRP